MLKKFFLSALILFGVFVFQILDNQKVSAKDFWVFNDGYADIYVMTETVKNVSENRDISIDACVKVVHKGRSLGEYNYHFYAHDAAWYSLNGSEMIMIYDFDTHTNREPMNSIYNFCVDYLGVHSPTGAG